MTTSSNPPPDNYLVLAGVGKAGTTSLFWYLSQLREVCPSKVKETRHFLPTSQVDPSRGPLAPTLSSYEAFFERCHGRYRMEATPHYFHGGESLVDALASTLSDLRVVITLREPVDRLWSIYRFAKNMLLIPSEVSIEQFAERAERIYRTNATQTVGNRPYWTSIRGSIYDQFVRPWFREFDESRLKVVFFEDLRTNPRLVVSELCDWLGINEDLSQLDYSAQNRSVDFRFAKLQRVALWANREGLLRDRRTLKRPLRTAYYAINGSRRPESMTERMRDRLRTLFADSNAELAELLVERGHNALPDWLAEPIATARGG